MHIIITLVNVSFARAVIVISPALFVSDHIAFYFWALIQHTNIDSLII